MIALLTSAPTLVTKTFTASTTWVPPYGVSRLGKAEGFGARGVNGYTDQSWRRDMTVSYFRRDGGIETQGGGSTADTGPVPGSDYCDGIINYSYEESPTYFASQKCYHYVDTSKTTPSTVGASATAFGDEFPGSTGDATPLTTAFTNIALTPGASYDIVVPAGGSITVTYYQ